MGANIYFCFNSTSFQANSKRWGQINLFFSNLHSSKAKPDPNKYYQKTWMHQWVRSWTILTPSHVALPDPPSLGSCHHSVLQQWVGYDAEALFLLTVSHNIFQAKRLNQLEMNTDQTGPESNNSLGTMFWSYPSATLVLSDPVLLFLPWQTVQEGAASHLLSPFGPGL